MANVIPTSFKSELLSGTHNFASGGNSFKIALYTDITSLSASTTAFTTTNEVSTTGKTHVAALHDGKVTEFTISPDDIGLRTASHDQLRGGDGDHNARYLRALLEGETGPYHDVVLFNAAAALVAGGHAEDLQQAAIQAQEALDSGKALDALDNLIAITNNKA